MFDKTRPGMGVHEVKPRAFRESRADQSGAVEAMAQGARNLGRLGERGELGGQAAPCVAVGRLLQHQADGVAHSLRGAVLQARSSRRHRSGRGANR